MLVNKDKVFNRRVLVVILMAVAVTYLIGVFVWGLFMNPRSYEANYANKFLSPSLAHPFGTDFIGRDMFHRTIKGLSNSIIIGVLASIFSSIIALLAGIASAVFGGWVDKFVNLCVDLCM